MKQLYTGLLLSFIGLIAQAQNVPQGMNYQAVARRLSGEVISDQPIALRINLYSGPQDSSTIFYSEVHNVTTTRLGLINLIIGSGKVAKGEFSKIPWSASEVWMDVGIKENVQQGFTTISSTRLLAVPYAFHAATASELVRSGKSDHAKTDEVIITPVEQDLKNAYWLTKGNVLNGTTRKLGSQDSTDFVLVTNSNERLRVKAEGYVRIPNLADQTPGSVKMVVVDENGQMSTQPLPEGGNTFIPSLDNVIQTGNATEGSVVFKSDNNFVEILPANYNEELKQGKFSMGVAEFPGVNDFDERSNVVGSFWGYNTTPWGGQAIPGEASYRFAGETYYDVAQNKIMEFHLPDMYTNSGLNVRPFSMYIDRATGHGSANYQLVEANFKKPEDGNIDWMRLRNDNGTVRMQMQPEEGNSSYIEMNGSIDYEDGPVRRNKAIVLNDGGGLHFLNSEGSFTFNNNLEVEGNATVKGLYANNNNPDPGTTAHALQGASTSNRLLAVGDETNPEKLYITPTSVVSGLNFMSMGDFITNGAFKPYSGGDLNLKFNSQDNNAKINFTSDANNVLAGQVSVDGIYAKTIQTEKPSVSPTAGKLKIGSVVNATVTSVTTKYLQIEIDGVNYKIPLVD